MIMKTVQKGRDKIEHVEYSDNIMYFYSSKDRNGLTKTERISRRIAGAIMKEFTDKEYDILLETVRKTARYSGGGTSAPYKKKNRSCAACPKKGSCKRINVCS